MLLTLWIVIPVCFGLLWIYSSGPWLLCAFRWLLAFLLITLFTFSLLLTLFLKLSFWPSSQPPSLHPIRPAFMCISWNINVFLGLPTFLVSLWDMEGFSCGNKSTSVWQATTALSVYDRCVFLSQYVRGRRKANWPTTNYNICFKQVTRSYPRP